MPIKKHDFVEVEYTGRLKDSSEVFDTTDEKTAKDAQIYTKGQEYKPIVICVGERHILPGIDEFLEGKDIGKFSVSLPADKAFGKKNPQLLQMIPASKFTEQKIRPIPNLRLNIDGAVGIVKTVSGGRTVVDFNHPLAGKDVSYELKVNKVVTDKKIQVDAILRVLLGIRTKVEVSGEKVKIEMPELPKEFLAELSKKIKELTNLEVEYDLKKVPAHDHEHCDDPSHKH